MTLVELARVLQGSRASTPRPSRRSARRWRSAARCSATNTAKPRPARTSSGCCCGSAAISPAPRRCFARTSRPTTRCSAPIIPTSATSKGNLALVLDARGQHAAAEALLRDDLVDPAQDAGRRASRLRAGAQQSGATCCCDQGRLDEAQPLLEQAVADRRGRSSGRIIRASGDDREPGARADCARPRRSQPSRRCGTCSRRGSVCIRPDDWRIAQVQSLLGAALTRQRALRGSGAAAARRRQNHSSRCRRQGREAPTTRASRRLYEPIAARVAVSAFVVVRDLSSRARANAVEVGPERRAMSHHDDVGDERAEDAAQDDVGVGRLRRVRDVPRGGRARVLRSAAASRRARGCSTSRAAPGSWRIPAARRGIQVTAIDLAANLVGQARATAAAEAGVHVQVDEGDAERSAVPRIDRSTLCSA